MKSFEYRLDAEGQLILSNACIRKAEKAFCDNDAQPLLDILEETVGKPLPASLSKLLVDILTGKVNRRKGVAKKFPLTDWEISSIGCLVRDLIRSGTKSHYAVRDVAEMFNPDPEFEQRLAEVKWKSLKSLRGCSPLETISLTRVKLAYRAFQAMERKRNQSLPLTSSSTQ